MNPPMQNDQIAVHNKSEVYVGIGYYQDDQGESFMWCTTTGVDVDEVMTYFEDNECDIKRSYLFKVNLPTFPLEPKEKNRGMPVTEINVADLIKADNGNPN